MTSAENLLSKQQLPGRARRPRFKDKHLVVLFLSAVAISAGIPGLLPFDPTGLTHDFGLFNISSEWRIAVFMVVSIALLPNIFVKTRFDALTASYPAPSTGLRLLILFFCWMAITTVLSVDRVAELAVPFYRLFEWALLLTIAWHLIPASRELAQDRYADLVKAVSLSALLVILALLVVEPSLAYAYSEDTGSVRLGGTAFTPNHLAVVFGVGALYWITTGKTSFRFPIAGVMLLCCLLTGSRSGIIGCGIGTCIYVALRGRAVAAVAMMLVGAFVLLIAGEQMSSFLSRGQYSDYIMSFSDRTYVWNAALELIGQSPIAGHGFIIGPKLIQNYFVESWWAPPHAHNDFLNSAVAGGVIAAAILAVIYLGSAIDAWKVRNSYPLLTATWTPFFISAIFEPAVSHQITVSTILLVCLFRTTAIAGRSANLARRRMNFGVNVAN